MTVTPRPHVSVRAGGADGRVLPAPPGPRPYWTHRRARGMVREMNYAEQYRPWNSVHENGGCNDTAPKGGAGKIYCFAID